MISNPVLRYNIEDWELTGAGNVARRNCVWSTRHEDNAGIQPGLGVATVENRVIEPRFLDQGRQGLPPAGGQPMPELGSKPPAGGQDGTREAGPGRETSQRHGVVWPGGHLRLSARVVSRSARASASKQAILKVKRDGSWRRVGTMRLHAGRYLYRPQLGPRRGALRRFGGLRVKRGARVLRLRAHVKGAGRSNVVRIRVGR